MSRIRVVVTGLGATTPLGGDVPSTWDGLLAGKSGVRKIEADWAADLPVQIAAQAAVDPAEILERVEARRLDRSAQLAVVAALEAWQDAGYGLREENPVDRERLGVAIATGIGGMITLLSNWDIQKEKGARRVSPLAIPMLMANASAANVSLRLGARAGVHTPVSACASSNESISLGLDMLRLGRADVAVVGGTEGVIHPLPIASFAQMQAMSRRNDEPERASRPWDVDRDGFVLARGRGHIRHRDSGARQGAWCSHLRRTRRSRHHRRCARHGPAGPDWRKSGPGHDQGTPRVRTCSRRHRARQRARHLHPTRRCHRGWVNSAITG